MLARLARGMVLFILATLTVVYIFSGEKRAPAPRLPSDQIIGYLNT